jgi:putative restriction endonuclease
MTQHERAVQLWSILVLAARNRQILTYDLVSQLSGLPRHTIGQRLAPVQDYCVACKLPPLTVLVVSEDTGMPGDGFIAAADIPAAQAKVFSHNWFGKAAPTDADFASSLGAARDAKNPA